MINLVQRLDRRLKKTINSSKGKIVDFIICGAQKGGTSSLDANLREHPEICMANKKEIHFFDREALFRHGNIPNYSKYHSYFKPKNSNLRVGEATPIYMYWHDSPRRIWEYNSNMKLIVLLRNPIDRAYSHWNMQRSKKIENLSFWDAIHFESERRRKALPYQDKLYSYIDRGFYMEQLRRLWAYFSRENVLILRSDCLMHQTLETLNQVCDFLDIHPFASIQPKSENSRSYLSEMSEKERAYLSCIFEYEIRSIERALGWDCSDWLEK